MISENVEDYLACIYDLSGDGAAVKTNQIASRLHISPASVTEMVKKLASLGYVTYEQYKGVRLTTEGMTIARRVKRRHRLLERFFVDILGMRKEDSHDEAMKLEHTVSDESVERISKILKDPVVCPDGDPIPPPELPQPDIKGLSVQLDKLRQGETASITHIASEDLDRVRRLISMGFVPGHDIVIEEKVPVGGPLLVRIEGRRIALAKDMASLVWVRRA